MNINGLDPKPLGVTYPVSLLTSATLEIFRFFSFRYRSSKTGQDAEDENGQNELDDELQRTSLHLYILNYSSPVLMLTRTAWNNYLVVSEPFWPFAYYISIFPI